MKGLLGAVGTNLRAGLQGVQHAVQERVANVGPVLATGGWWAVGVAAAEARVCKHCVVVSK